MNVINIVFKSVTNDRKHGLRQMIGTSAAHCQVRVNGAAVMSSTCEIVIRCMHAVNGDLIVTRTKSLTWREWQASNNLSPFDRVKITRDSLLTLVNQEIRFYASHISSENTCMPMAAECEKNYQTSCLTIFIGFSDVFFYPNIDHLRAHCWRQAYFRDRVRSRSICKEVNDVGQIEFNEETNGKRRLGVF